LFIAYLAFATQAPAGCVKRERNFEDLDVVQSWVILIFMFKALSCDTRIMISKRTEIIVIHKRFSN